MTDATSVSLEDVNEKVRRSALETLGLSVLGLQGFEKAFALIYLSHKTAMKMGDKFTAKFDMGEPDYRTTTTAHIKNLQQAGRIDTKLADRLLQLVNKRHELIHRWTIQHGWPADDDAVKWIELMTACAWVVTETGNLISLLGKQVHRSDGETDTEYSSRQAELFKIAGAAARMRATGAR